MTCAKQCVKTLISRTKRTRWVHIAIYGVSFFRVGDRACKSGSAVLLAPGILSPRKLPATGTPTGASLRCAPCTPLTGSFPGKIRHLSGGRTEPDSASPDRRAAALSFPYIVLAGRHR
jgi:hypothetical protein